MEQEKKNYEINFLLKNEEDKEVIVNIFKKLQLSISGDSGISKIKLSYPIKKENFAFFGSFYFSTEPANIINLTEELRNKKNILRFSILFRPIIEERKREENENVDTGKKKLLEEYSKKEKISVSQETSKAPRTENLSNEALEKRLEEILK
ncbi:30S ribosomal protein S6 [Candidatus Wolfebacteria bacterium]|nr:30S ribosomal protein S6 [Candidatus Wolfebacteria bacterium]